MKRGRVARIRHSIVAMGVALMVVFVAELLVYTWCRVQYVRTGYEVAEATKEHQRLLELHTKLRVEEARLRSPERIMRIAQQRGLVIPDAQQIVVIP
jgi:cell division protein FtsL